MSEAQEAEVTRLEARRRLSTRLMKTLTRVRAKYEAQGIRLRIEVDNDCWYLTTADDAHWTDEIGADLRKARDSVLNVEPAELACLLAIQLGFDAGRP